MEEIRVRFPPSPTGYLHIGSARTALYNWLFARGQGGKLVFRIEDTDAERSTDESEKAIVEGLEWLGIDWDEGPYRQSERIDLHKSEAGRLVHEGKAYLCFCSKDDLDAKRKQAESRKETYHYDRTCLHMDPEERERRIQASDPFVVRFRRPDGPGSVTFDDLVYGPQEVSLEEIDDFVIVRSNGQPLYILSNVVDDHEDRISHVIRGQDHLINTPKQVLLYEALGYERPRFAHMSLTLDPRKAKISKRRHGEVVAVEWYREHGFLASGFVNFMALLGWSPGDDREEFLSMRELVEAFSLDGLSRTNAVFNYRKDDPKFITDPKALHINGLHIRNLPIERIVPVAREDLVRAGLWQDRWDDEEADWFASTVDLLRQRYTLTTDFSSRGRPYFSDDFPMEEKAVQKNLRKDPVLSECLPRLADALEDAEPFDLEGTERVVRALADEMGVKAGLLINATRTAVTGQSVGPGLFDVLVTLGRERTVARIRRSVEWI